MNVVFNTARQTMTDVKRVGIDLAKKIFHVTAVNAVGAVMERKRLRRTGLQSYLTMLPPSCVVAMEACGSAHHWGAVRDALGSPGEADEPAQGGALHAPQQE